MLYSESSSLRSPKSVYVLPFTVTDIAFMSPSNSSQNTVGFDGRSKSLNFDPGFLILLHPDKRITPHIINVVIFKAFMPIFPFFCLMIFPFPGSRL